jgi:hypothetical protein
MLKAQHKTVLFNNEFGENKLTQVLLSDVEEAKQLAKDSITFQPTPLLIERAIKAIITYKDPALTFYLIKQHTSIHVFKGLMVERLKHKDNVPLWVLALLLKEGANPHLRLDNFTLLFHAVRVNDFELGKLLVKYGASPHTKEPGNITAMLLAVKWKRKAFVELFLNGLELTSHRWEGEVIKQSYTSPVFHTIERNTLPY